MLNHLPISVVTNEVLFARRDDVAIPVVARSAVVLHGVVELVVEVGAAQALLQHPVDIVDDEPDDRTVGEEDECHCRYFGDFVVSLCERQL